MVVKEGGNGCVRAGNGGGNSVAKRGVEKVPMQPARSALGNVSTVRVGACGRCA